MSLTNAIFEEVSERDLEELIESRMPEGQRIEYKSALYGGKDEQKKEFLKDASSFANTYGGHLIIGMKEVQGVADRIAPLVGIDVDQEIARLENLLRDGLQPRVVGIQIRSVPVSPQGHVILLRIPRSWNPPHRVSFQNWNRVFARNSAGAHEMSMDELRASFTLGASAYDRARAFRSERLALIDALETPVAIVDQPRDRLVLHLLPLSAFAEPGSAVDLTSDEQRRRLDPTLWPIGWRADQQGDATRRINYEGYVTWTPSGPTGTRQYTQLFRSGIVEAVFVQIVYAYQQRPGSGAIPAVDLERFVICAVQDYIQALKFLGVSPPILVAMTLQNVRGAVYRTVGEPFVWGAYHPINKIALELPESVINGFGDASNYCKALRPIFNVLWNTAGLPEDRFIDKEGRWTGRVPL